MSDGNLSQMQKLILDVAVSLQRRKLSESFATSWYITGIGPEEIGKSAYDPIQKGHLPDSGMQTDMSITVGLARKGLLTYSAYIFRFRLEEVQKGSRPESQKLTAFMIADTACESCS